MSWARIVAEIDRTPELSAAEERTLAESIAAGDAEARRALIAANLRHALPIARALAKEGQRWEPGDLLGEAVRALDGLAGRWDGTGRFGGYARARLRGAMKDFLRRRADVIRTPADSPRVLSLDHQEDGEEGRSLLDRLEAGEDAGETLEALPAGLTLQERRVLLATVLRDPPGHPRDAARELGLLESTVRRALRSALRRGGAATGGE